MVSEHVAARSGAPGRDEIRLEDPFQAAFTAGTAALDRRWACCLLPRALVVVGTVSVAILFPAFGASAQGSPTPPQAGWLSAAIEEVRQSPFHAAESILHSGALPLGIGATKGWPVTMEASPPGWSIQSAARDSSFSKGRVFLATWIAAATSDLAALYLEGNNHALAAIATPIFGTAVGAKVGGAPFLPSLGGSALGFGVGWWWAATVFDEQVDFDQDPLVFIAITAAIQAGITTLIASVFD